jgi:hypothetical protein
LRIELLFFFVLNYLSTGDSLLLYLGSSIPQLKSRVYGKGGGEGQSSSQGGATGGGGKKKNKGGRR